MMNVQDFLQKTECANSEWPQWFLDLYNRARVHLKEGSFVDKLDEAWRFGRQSRTDLSGFSPSVELSEDRKKSILARIPSPVVPSWRFVLLNGKLVSGSQTLPDGLIVETLDDFIRNSPKAEEVLSAPFESLGMKNFTLLPLILGGGGVVVRTESGVSIENPVEIIHIVEGERAFASPMTIILTGKHSKVDVLERHCSGSDDEAAIFSLQKLILNPGSTLRYSILQQLNERSRVFELADIALEENACLEHLSRHTGAAWARQEVVCSLLGRGADAQLLSTGGLEGSRELDQRTWQRHACPGAKSNLLFKNVLRDMSRITFSGMICVDEGAHETDAYQRNLNLLLSDGAEVNSMPGLEILADGVRCSHGAATAPIDPEQIFYLESRGINRSGAEAMIADGFLRQVFELFSSENILSLADQVFEIADF